jgi:hypothetical protein
VRTPALPIGPSYLHLLGAWFIVIGALVAMARALPDRRHGRGGRDG